jgi:hypothetical protein
MTLRSFHAPGTLCFVAAFAKALISFQSKPVKVSSGISKNSLVMRGERAKLSSSGT